MMSIDVKSIAILNMPSADYHCIITGISKSEAVNLLKKIMIWVRKVEHYEI